MPLVSICIPTYKQVDYLKKCLQSVLSQDFTDYELIISDDTPDDSVKTVVHDILKDRPFIYLHNKPSLGSPANWNHAIAQANGTYIKLLHHDDFFTKPDSLSCMVREIESKQADFLFTETKVWYPATDFSRIHSLSAKHEQRMKRDIGFLFFRNCIGSPSATLYRRDAAVVFDEKLIWLVDVDFYIQYIQKHKAFCFYKAPLICTAHETENQVTGTVIRNRTIQVKEHVLLFDKLIKSGAKPSAFTSFFGYLFRDFSVMNYKDLVEIVPEAANHAAFFESVLAHAHAFVFLKKVKRRLYADRYINFLKLDQF
ncbi:MAG: glycosyltransferase family 2 protein [Bacteroidetes bacterium]|nr:glycosyltransferase family 2 protein [Bacteroidota bacterium]